MNKLTTQSIKISVLIATRNRPDEFLTALNSVLAQSYLNIEVIVVNDGSDEEHLTHYHVIENNNSRVKFIYLAKRPNGHGPSFARNTAAQNASGDFLAFLDDDDIWTDPDHLSRFVSTLNANKQLEVYFSNQKAINSEGIYEKKPLWLESLIASISEQLPITSSAVFATSEWLLSTNGFAHLNCTIINKSLFDRLKGFDESLRYEEDKDLYWRLVDSATNIVFDQNFVALHYIPEQRLSASNAFDILKKREIQIYIAEKNLRLAKSYKLQTICRKAVANSCKHLAEFLNKNKLHKLAYYFAARALAASFGFKWALFTLFLFIKNIKRDK